MPAGYQDTILRVDLSTGAITRAPLPPEDVLRRFVGGTGLGVYYLLHEAPMNVEATDPRAPFMIMTGPLAGTAAPSSANWVTICFHLSIPYAAGIGHAHGFWGARLKHAGYEGLIAYGRAPRPVYLWIDDDRVELRDAAPYWGLGTRETERRIKEDLGDPERISVACIGPAGEALLPGASVKADRNHGAGKGSPGAIMGSKHLKAIAVRGTGRVRIAHPEAFEAATADWSRRIGAYPKGTVAFGLHEGGVTRRYNVSMGDTYRVAFKNMSDPEAGKAFARNWVDAASRWKVTPQPSYNCPVGCSYDLRITDGEFSGFRASFCGGGENFDGAAGMIGVTDPAQAVVITDHYDDMGLEAGTFGSIVGAAFEGYNRGWLTKEDTDGLDLSWGNWEAAMTLIERAIKREGIGAKLAEGIKGAARLLGEPHGLAEEFQRVAVHVKGAGVNMHDWRPSQSILFGYLVAGSGPAHFGMGSDYMPIDEAGFPTTTPGVTKTREEALAKVDGVRRSQFFKVWWDSLGVCWFAVAGMSGGLRATVDAVRHATGWDDLTNEGALEIGERIVNALRLVYEHRGFQKRDELDYSPRYTELAPAGPARDSSIEPHVAAMIDEYYRQMGWDVATGRVTGAGIERLGLGDVAART